MTDFDAARSVHTSVVIPVYNKWELTEACLRSLAETLPDKACEIIVVDNASSDATRQACPALGQTLFRDLFVYHRSETNLNFGPASNLGAKMGRGEYVLFLNNDTLALPGWYDPLLQDFRDYPGIAATGPMLLYPGTAPLGDTVQHLGVFITPTFKVGHLYEGTPANSPLAAKRRFFQVITAACMLMPRALFLEHGGFDEGFINGYEDVDLCIRLCAADWRMTVNPEARLYHLTSQTTGRHSHDEANSRRFAAGSMRHLVPDWHIHLASDGLELQVTEWQSMHPGMPARDRAKLAPLLAAGDADALAGALRRFPLWHEGHAKLTRLLRENGDDAGAHTALLSLTQLRPTPEYLFSLLESADRRRDHQAMTFAFSSLSKYYIGFDEYVKGAEALRSWTADLGLDDLAGQFRRWSDESETFREQLYLPFLRRLRKMTKALSSSPLDNWVYTLWRELEDLPERERRRQNPPQANASVAFSVLMPVYNPEPKHLREAVDSLLAQSWPHWELCLADDASPDPAIRPLLEKLAALDPRIRVEFRDKNGHIAAAANTALDMARHEWIALMDQEDLLTPDALLEMAAAITAHPDGLLFYSDEDKLRADGNIFAPYFKNNSWDWDLLLSQNLVKHLGVYRADHLRAINGFRDGFPGAQDHDMILRYVEDLDGERLIHIPKVLYHWRARAGSTAAGIETKPEALDSAMRAVTEHLHRKRVQASVEVAPGTQYLRVRYTLPTPAPLATLIVDLGDDCLLGQALSEALPAKAGYGKLEILLLYDNEADPAFKARLERWATGQRPTRSLCLPRGLSFGQRANAAVKTARGSLIGFLDKGLIPLSQGWLTEIVSRLVQPGVGAVGGKLMLPGGIIHHLGHLADARGRLFSLFRGLPIEGPGSLDYFSWAKLARTVRSVDPRCLFTHKRFLEEVGGFDPDMDSAAGIDFCLRLGEAGQRTSVTPWAEFLCASSSQLSHFSADFAIWEHGIFVDSPSLSQRWRGRVAPCNPNLDAGDKNWNLHWDQSPGLSSLKENLPARGLPVPPPGPCRG